MNVTLKLNMLILRYGNSRNKLIDGKQENLTVISLEMWSHFLTTIFSFRGPVAVVD